MLSAMEDHNIFFRVSVGLEEVFKVPIGKRRSMSFFQPIKDSKANYR